MTIIHRSPTNVLCCGDELQGSRGIMDVMAAGQYAASICAGCCMVNDLGTPGTKLCHDCLMGR